MTIADLRESLVRYLTAQGIHALGAWEGDRTEHDHGVIAVGLQQLRCAPLGQQDYLGCRFVEELGQSCQVYARRLALTYALDLYVPRGEGGAALALMDQLAQAVCLGGPEGLHLGALTCGGLSYDRESGMLTCRATLEGQGAGVLYQREDGTEFLDFKVKGELIV